MKYRYAKSAKNIITILIIIVLLSFIKLFPTIETNHKRLSPIKQIHQNNDHNKKGMEREDENSGEISFDCNNINDIQMMMFLGGGAWKNVYTGYYKGKLVAMKTVRNYMMYNCSKVTREGKKGKGDRCYFHDENKMKYNNSLWTKLSHPNIIRDYGCCDNGHDEIAKLQTRGPVCISAMGTEWSYGHLRTTWHHVLEVMIDFSGLFVYLQNTPYGSFRLDDFLSRNFLFSGGKIKISDPDSLTNSYLDCNAKLLESTRYEPFCAMYRHIKARKHSDSDSESIESSKNGSRLDSSKSQSISKASESGTTNSPDSELDSNPGYNSHSLLNKVIDQNALFNLYYLNKYVLRSSLYEYCRLGEHYVEECSVIKENLKHGQWSPKDLQSYLQTLLKTTKNIIF